MANRNRRRRVQENGAPTGYGQQSGQSPFLDQSQADPAEGDGREPIFAHQRNAPAAPARPEPQPEPAFEEQMGPPEPAQQPQHLQQALGRRTAAQPLAAIGQRPQTAAMQAMAPQQPQAPGAPQDIMAALQQKFPAPQQPYQGAEGKNGGLRPQVEPDDQFTPFQDPNQYGQGPQAQPQGQPQAGGTLADAARAAAANNYTDIAGAEKIGAGNFVGQLEGFGNIDPNGERGSNTHKKLFGRIASRYDVSQPGAVRSLMQDPDFAAAFPDAKLVEHENADLIDFGDGNPVDVIRGAVAGGSGQGWQWGVNAGQGAPQGGGPMDQSQFMPSNYSAGQGGDQMSQQLMAALQGGAGQFGDGSVSIEQLLAALGLGQQAQPILQPQGQQQLV